MEIKPDSVSEDAVETQVQELATLLHASRDLPLETRVARLREEINRLAPNADDAFRLRLIAGLRVWMHYAPSADVSVPDGKPPDESDSASNRIRRPLTVTSARSDSAGSSSELAAVALTALTDLAKDVSGRADAPATIEHLSIFVESLRVVIGKTSASLRQAYILRRAIEDAIGRHEFDETLTPHIAGREPANLVSGVLDWTLDENERSQVRERFSYSWATVLHFPSFLFTAYMDSLRTGCCRVIEHNLAPSLLCRRSLPSKMSQWVRHIVERGRVPFLSRVLWLKYCREYFRLLADDSQFFENYFRTAFQKRYWEQVKNLRINYKQHGR